VRSWHQRGTGTTMASRKPRRLLTAYILWLWPFYPLYAMYLGRDTHCWLYTITFGGFGLGWMFDALAMPLYVADHNEPDGYSERAEARHNAWFAWSTLFGPARWGVLALVSIQFGLVVANLVPPDAILAAVAASLYQQAFGEPGPPAFWLVAFRLAVAVLGASVGLRLATPCVLTVRRRCRFRHMLGWGLVVTAVISVADGALEKIEAEGIAPQVCVVALATTIGALRGRAFAPYSAPKRTTRHAFSLRLVRQLLGVGVFTAACGSAFYLNGSYTHTDRETGETTTYSGREAYELAFTNLQAFSGDASRAIHQLRQQYQNSSWSDILAELREAFADPAVEAAEVLGVPRGASAAEVRKAHRELARAHHPDKVGDSAEAQQKMARINWAKDVLMARHTDTWE
jgi:hypothetical protein